MGDLNYRVPLPEGEAKSILKKGGLAELLEFDQLTIERNAKRVFQGFDEAPIEFAPTYKYDIGTSRFDTSEKRRSPSWCDRILYFRNPLKKEDPDWLVNEWYRSCMELSLSDHKPVMGLFGVKVRKIDQKRYEETLADIYRDLDKYENEAVPDLVVDSNVLDFGAVSYGVKVVRRVVVENRGVVIAGWRFVGKGPDGEGE
ncbi:hypothetical protein HK097_006872, partial [Rhizophlyctis rosea]